MERLTGDPSTDALLPAASALVWAVKTDDGAEVARILADYDPRALAVVLSALVLDDQPPSVLLSWRLDTAEYQRLRATGVDSLTAMAILRGRAAPTSAA